MSKKSLLAAALLLCLGTAAMAKPKHTKTITIISGSGKVLVNGKEYTGGPISNKDVITVTGGEVTMKIGDATIKAGNDSKFTVVGNSVRNEGAVPLTVTTASGQTQDVKSGGAIVIAPTPNTGPETPSNLAPVVTDLGTTPPPPNPTQNTDVVSPSAP